MKKNIWILLIVNILNAINASGQIITTVVGNGTQGYGGNGGPALSAQLYSARTIIFDQAGNLYIGDECEIRVVNTKDTINVIAGQSTCGYTGDSGPATSAKLDGVISIAFDPLGNIFFSDVSNGAIRYINNGGIINTLCHNGSMPVVACNNSNVLYVGGGAQIDKITTTSCSYTAVIGSGPVGYSGDNGPASAAQINNPDYLVFDANGNIYFAETGNHTVRKVNTMGIITTIAGTGTPGYSGDNGPATNAQLNTPIGIDVDQYGNVYIADKWNHRVRKVDTNGIITTIAGIGAPGFSGDNGLATLAQLNQPINVAVRGNDLYISDWVNFRIRKINNVAGIASDNGWQPNVLIYPNPANSILHLEIAEPEVQVTIGNVLGEELKTFKASKGKTTIDTSEWPEGIYFIQTKTGYNAISKKIIVQH